VVAAKAAQKRGLLNPANYDTTIPSGRDKVRGVDLDWSNPLYQDLMQRDYQGSFIHDTFTSQSRNTHEETQVIVGLATRYGKRNIAVELDKRQKDRWATDFVLQMFGPNQPSEFAMAHYQEYINMIANENDEWELFRDSHVVTELIDYIDSRDYLEENQKLEQTLMVQLLHVIAHDPHAFYETTPEELHALSLKLQENTQGRWKHDIITQEEWSALTADTVIKPILAEDIFAATGHKYMDSQLQERKSIQRTIALNKGGAALMMAGVYYAPFDTRIAMLRHMIENNGQRPSIVRTSSAI
jgi:hypothetical protein